MDTLEEQQSIKTRQRLWGAAVLIAMAVIFLPLLLDGAGSESQYRRVERLREEPPRVVRDDGQLEPAPQIATISTVVKDATVEEAEQSPEPVIGSAVSVGVLTAWVVQAGSFGDEQNAIAVRDRLRRAGHPSFINASDDQSLFRVKVGPMTNQDQAKRTRDEIIQLLGRDALVTPYP